MMTNAGVKELITKYGPRICAFCLNNGKVLRIGYNDNASCTIEEIEFETIGGCDMMVVPMTDIATGSNLKYKEHIVTEFLENIVIMDEEFEKYRIDPHLF